MIGPGNNRRGKLEHNTFASERTRRGDLSDVQNEDSIRQVDFDWPFMPRRRPRVSHCYLEGEEEEVSFVTRQAIL